jgi:hypothetical protein
VFAGHLTDAHPASIETPLARPALAPTPAGSAKYPARMAKATTSTPARAASRKARSREDRAADPTPKSLTSAQQREEDARARERARERSSRDD